MLSVKDGLVVGVSEKVRIWMLIRSAIALVASINGWLRGIWWRDLQLMGSKMLVVLTSMVYNLPSSCIRPAPSH